MFIAPDTEASMENPLFSTVAFTRRVAKEAQGSGEMVVLLFYDCFNFHLYLPTEISWTIFAVDPCKSVL